MSHHRGAVPIRSDSPTPRSLVAPVTALALALAATSLAACSTSSAAPSASRREEAAPAVPAPAPKQAAEVDAGAQAAAAKLAHRLAGYKTILHVGDSTVGYTQGLQLELKKKLEPLGVRYVSRTLTSGGLRTFAQKKIVEGLIKEHNPDLVIVQLGTNNVTVPNPPAFLPAIEEVVAEAKVLPCYWVGPLTLEQKAHGMNEFLRDHVAPCAFIDSFGLKLDRQEDKIHPTQLAARKWANYLWEQTEKSPPGAPARP